MKRSSLAAIGVLFVGLVAAGGVLAGIKYLSIRRAAAEGGGFEPPSAVTLARVKEVSWQPMADLVGSVVALRSVTVSNEIPGTIRTMNFDSGAVVEPGSVLLTLDDSTERADLAAAEASVRVAEASVAVADSRLWLAESEATRLDSAMREDAASKIEADRVTSELARAKADRDRLIAEVDLAKARVSQAVTRLEKLTIRAPFRGRAGLRNMHEGQYLAEGTSIVALQEVGDVIYLDFAIPQEYIARVNPGTVVMATADVFGEKPVAIEVAAIDARVNNETRNVRVRAKVDNRSGVLRPGMFVQIRVPTDEPRPTLVIPTTAVRRTSYADQVFTVVAGEKPGELRARQRFVKLGPALGDEIVLLEGLALDEEVVSGGSFKLRDGALITTAPPRPADGVGTGGADAHVAK